MVGISEYGKFVGLCEWVKVDYYTSRPMETQERILMSILKKNKDTEYGKKIGFEGINSIEEFRKKYPTQTMTHMQTMLTVWLQVKRIL